jgi:hypothetical protein
MADSAWVKSALGKEGDMFALSMEEDAGQARQENRIMSAAEGGPDGRWKKDRLDKICYKLDRQIEARFELQEWVYLCISA